MLARYRIPALILSVLLLAACSLQQEDPATDNSTRTPLVNPADLISGGPPKDGIPSIDHPTFSSVAESTWIPDDAEVFVLAENAEVKVYPQPILVWHEIVNDEIAGTPVAVTYCPLCGSSVAYKRIVATQPTTFGTTGKLYNSNLVMYDRLTNTYWTQIKGEAIIGERAGDHLEKVPLQTMTWNAAKTRFPNALILSRDTGYTRDYTRDPYKSYYLSDDLYFPVGTKDVRLGAKAVVIGLAIGGVSKAYPELTLAKGTTITDVVGEATLEIQMDDDGFLTIENIATGERIPWERGFWFAWYAFHPETQVYSVNDE